MSSPQQHNPSNRRPHTRGSDKGAPATSASGPVAPNSGAPDIRGENIGGPNFGGRSSGAVGRESSTRDQGARPSESPSAARPVKFPFVGLPTVEATGPWNEWLQKEIGRGGLTHPRAKQYHAVAELFLKHLWHERGMPLYEGRVTDPSKEASKRLGAQILRELIPTIAESDVSSFHRAVVSEYGRGQADAAREVLNTAFLPILRGKAPSPIVLQGASRLDAALRYATTGEIGPSASERTQRSIQDLSIKDAPPFYAKWLERVHSLLNSSDEAGWVVSGRAGVVRSYVQHVMSEAKAELGSRASISAMQSDAQRRMCECASDSLEAYLEPLKDGLKNQKYHTHRQALLQHFYPFLRESKLTDFEPLYDSVFLPTTAPVGDWWPQFFHDLVAQVQAGEKPEAAQGSGYEPLSRDGAVRSGRIARALIEWIASQPEVSTASNPQEALERELFSSPREQMVTYLSERFTLDDQWFATSWGALHLGFFSSMKSRGNCGYNATAQVYIPPSAEFVHPLAEFWAQEIQKEVAPARPSGAHPPLAHRAGVIRGKTLQMYLEGLAHSVEAKTLIRSGEVEGTRESLINEAVTCLVDDQAPLRIDAFCAELQRQGTPERVATQAYLLLRNEFYPKAQAAGLLHGQDFARHEFMQRFAQPLPFSAYEEYRESVWELVTDKAQGIQMTQASSRLRWAYAFLESICADRAADLRDLVPSDPQRVRLELDRAVEQRVRPNPTGQVEPFLASLEGKESPVTIARIVRPALNQAFLPWYQSRTT